MAERVRPIIYDGTKEDDIFEALPTLESFPQLPLTDFVTLCEINAELQVAYSPDVSNPVGTNVFTPLTDKYIAINEVVLKPTVSKRIPSIRGTFDDDGFLIRPREEGVLKSAWDGWNDEGLDGLIKGLRKAGAPLLFINAVTGILKFQTNVMNSFQYINTRFYPHLALETDDLIQNFAPVRQWKKCWIRAICWHPSYSAMAIALNDDTIRVVAHDLDVVSMLKHADQRMVSCLSWRSYGSELAVGVQSGLLIWYVKGSVKPSSSCVKLYQVPGHCPITSVDYSSNGKRLVTSSAVDKSLIIWNTDSWTPTPLARIGGGGIPRAAWCNDLNNRIFCTTPTSLFRIWTFEEGVHARTWNTASKPVEAFAWSPCGSTVIFVSDFILYSLSLKPCEIELISEKVEPLVTPLFNLKVCTIGQSQSELRYKAGGKVLQIEWDTTGTRLAILFSDSELIPVFRVQKKSSTILNPCGFIRGHGGELPVSIAFQKNFKEGALLAIAWSSRRIQYFPMIFTQPSQTTTAVIQEPKYYVNYKNVNLTRMSGITSDTTKLPVDFGPSFSQFPQNGPGGDTGLESSTFLNVPQTRPKLFSN